MKRPSNCSLLQPPGGLATARAFTLTEMWITLTIFGLVVSAMVSLQIFGFKLNSFTSGKLTSTKGSLKILDQVANQIRGSVSPVVIGNFNTNFTTFTPVANGQLAAGAAIQITNTPTSFTYFYLNTNTHAFYERVTTSASTNLYTLASAIVNPQPFQVQNCYGTNISVGSQDNYTIQMTLSFSNVLYRVPYTNYDVYSLQSRATPRVQNH